MSSSSPAPSSSPRRGRSSSTRGGPSSEPAAPHPAPPEPPSPLNLHMSSSSPPGTPSSVRSLPRAAVAGGLAPAGGRGPRAASETASSAPSTPRTPLRGMARPWNQRNDLGASRIPQTPSSSQYDAEGSEPRGLGSEADLAVPQSASDAMANTVIWGTTVVVDEAYKAFDDFVEKFPDPSAPDEPLFKRLFARIAVNEVRHINIDTEYLRSYAGTRKLYRLLLAYPQEIIPIMDMVVNNAFMKKYSAEALQERGIQVRPFNIEKKTNMRDLNPSDIDRLISVKGLVIRASNVIPDLKLAFFQCSKCGYTVEKEVDRGRVEEPNRCENPECAQVKSMNIIYNRCKYADKQIVRLQETPDTIPDGQTPHTVTLMTYDDLVDVPRPGDRVEVTGVYRAVPVRVNPRQQVIHQLYRTYVDVVHFKQVDTKRVRANRQDVDPEEYINRLDEAEVSLVANESMERKIKDLAGDPEIVNRLLRSLAPSIYEMSHVKHGVLCQLFGGTNKPGSKMNMNRFRGEINVLLCGDPGTSKSQMLQYVHKIAPRGIYTSGKGSSAVGLTAYVTRDPDSKQFVLESGALVLSDGGICCIDEFDKMSDSTRSVLHEVMEQQTVSIAKAGIICTLNARTSILASANPQNSRYDTSLSVVQNLQLPPTLVSRFDLIYLILDKPDERNDAHLARHIVSMYQSTQGRALDADVLDQETLTAYISYAREQVHPELSDDAAQDLIEAYADLRKGSGSRHTVSATPRQLESLIRLSEANAKMRLSPVVTKADVREAMKLMKAALLLAATDPTTGRVDMDLLATGQSASARARVADLAKKIRLMMAERTTPLALLRLVKEVNRDVPESKAHSTAQVLEAIRELEDAQYLVMTGDVRSNTAVLKKLGSDE